MPSEPLIGGLTVTLGAQTVTNNEELNMVRRVDTVGRCLTLLLVLKDTLNFLIVCRDVY